MSNYHFFSIQATFPFKKPYRFKIFDRYYFFCIIGHMIPIGDDNSLRKTIPLVTFALIALNVLVFFLEMSGGEEFILQWAFIPIQVFKSPGF